MPQHRPPPAIEAGHDRPAGRLIGRERQCALLDDLVGGLVAGRAATVGISGPAGTGRTALLRRVVATAREHGAAAGLASCSPVEAEIPFSAVSQLVAALHPPARFADLAAECFGGPGAATVPLLCEVFGELAAEGPLVLAVDDLQWADAWSVRWFAAMAAWPGPVLLAAAAHGPLPGYLGNGFAGDVHQLDLPPLTEAETTALLPETFGTASAAAVLGIVRGRPAVLHDIAARGAAGGRPDPVRLGREVTSARAARVRRGLPPDALALLRALSVSGELDVALAGRLAGLPETGVAGALAPLVASGLVAAGRPAEPHLEAEVLAELDVDARGDLHRRAAELAHGTGAGVAVAAELLCAAPPVGERWARTVLVDAAEQWFRQGRPPAAARALRRALLEPLEPVERAALLLRLASTEVTQDPDAADGRLRRILTDPGLSTLPAVVPAADLLLARGDVETTRRTVSESCAPAAAPPRQEEPGRSTVDPDLVALGRIAQEEAAVDPDMPVAPLPLWDGEPRGAAEAGAEAWWLATRGTDRGRVLDLAERALIVREDAPLMPRVAACRALLCCDELEAAAEGLTAVAAAARRRDARAAAAQALLHRAAVALRRDRPGDALHDLAAAGRELPVRCWHPALVPAHLAVEIAAHLRLGRPERAHHLAGEPLPRGGEHTAAQAFLLHAQAELALATDDPETALAAARECGRIFRSRQWVNPMLAPWRSLAGLALRRLGDGAAATDLFTEELALAGYWGTGTALEAERARAAAGLRRGVPLQRRPVEAVSEPGRRFEPRRPDALSPAERDVAALAARGLPNREIARELSIALRTVELRLTKVYRKLGLKGRSALTDRWATRTPGD